MKKLLIILSLILSLSLIVCACDASDSKKDDNTESKSEEGAPLPESDTETDTDDTTVSETESTPASETETDTETETEAAPTHATYKVTYTDENGAPVAGVAVQLCNGSLCLPPVFTDQNGVAVFPNVMIASYTVTITDGANSLEFEFEEGSYELEISKDVEVD